MPIDQRLLSRYLIEESLRESAAELPGRVTVVEEPDGKIEYQPVSVAAQVQFNELSADKLASKDWIEKTRARFLARESGLEEPQ